MSNLTTDEKLMLNRYAMLKREVAEAQAKLAAMTPDVLRVLNQKCEGRAHRHNGPRIKQPYTLRTRHSSSWSYGHLKKVVQVKEELKKLMTAAKLSGSAKETVKEVVVFTDEKGLLPD